MFFSYVLTMLLNANTVKAVPEGCKDYSDLRAFQYYFNNIVCL